MRKIIIGIAALLLSACGAKTYPVAASEAYESISSLGSDTLEPLPGGLSPVDVSFESSAADNAIQWKFSHENDDIATIVAKIDPKGDAASDVTVYYADGTAPSGNWRNSEARALIKGQIMRLVNDAVDARITKRPMDADLKKEVYAQVAMSSIGSMMEDVGTSMDAAVKEFDKQDKERKISRTNSAAREAASKVGKPMTDLGGSNP
jgi:molybdopterin-binding protein